jgi:hypothetical protein
MSRFTQGKQDEEVIREEGVLTQHSQEYYGSSGLQKSIIKSIKIK